MSRHRTVYLPVAVVVIDGKVDTAYIDHDGMPWSEWDTNNIYDDTTEAWIHADDAGDDDEIALKVLGAALDRINEGAHT